jgi:hypothetical protein
VAVVKFSVHGRLAAPINLGAAICFLEVTWDEFEQFAVSNVKVRTTKTQGAIAQPLLDKW